MNRILALTTAVLLSLTTVSTFAGNKNKGDNTPPDTTSCVSSVSNGSSPGSGTININGDAPFSVTSSTAIIVDGKNGTLADVKVGMLVISRTAPDSSAPEIDLKTLPPQPTKKNKKNNGD